MTSTATLSTLLILWSIWIRRHTWNCKWERASTVFVLLMGLTGVFEFPPTGQIIGSFLQSITDLYNLQNYLAEVTFLGGLCAIIYSAVSKLTPDAEFRHWFKNRIEFPLGIGITGTFILFAASKVTDQPHPDFVTMKMPGPTLCGYWMLYCALTYYLLFHASRAFIDLWFDKPSRPFVNIYLAATACITIGTTLRLGIAVFRPQTNPMFCAAFIAYAIGVGLFAFGAGWMWTTRLRQLAGRPGWAWRGWNRFSAPPGEREDWPGII